MDGSCLCGAVFLSVAHEPAEVTDCNCGACRRYGALWAYYTEDQVTISGATVGYGRNDLLDQDEPHLAFHHCVVCGCLTHWESLNGRPRMGVNARLLDDFRVDAVRLRRLNGAGDWTEVIVEPTAS